MKTLKLLLLPQPGATAEYLDDVEIVNPNTTALQIWNEQLVTASRGEAEGERNQLTLEGYTRDSWPWKPVAEENVWLTITVRSITGRQKLSGFCDYLKQRQKSCYGRFPPRGVFVVTYTQQRPSAQAAATSSQQMECRIAVDMTKIAKCTLKPIESNVQMVSHQPPPVQPTPPPPTEESVLKSTKSSRGGGLLGKLVGAQQRTNQHVVNSTTATTGRNVSTASLSAGVISNTDPSMEDQQRSLASFRTAQDVLAEFRQAMQDKMLDFDISDDEELKVTISLAEYTTGLSVEDKSKVTMEILKYMVYEAAEEVNEEWVTYKEPSEFMDEVVIAVYKEGAAPPDVLEEINKGNYQMRLGRNNERFKNSDIGMPIRQNVIANKTWNATCIAGRQKTGLKTSLCSTPISAIDEPSKITNARSPSDRETSRVFKLFEALGLRFVR